MHEELCGYLFDEYICKGLNPSAPILLQALYSMLPSVGNLRIVIDGVDEWDLSTVRKLLTDLMRLTTVDCGSHKLLISSRDVSHISRLLCKKPTLSLSEEILPVRAAIRAYAHARISDLQDQMSDALDASVLRAIEERLVEKSNGT